MSGDKEKNHAEPSSKWNCRRSDERSYRRRLSIRRRRRLSARIPTLVHVIGSSTGDDLWTFKDRRRRRDLREISRTTTLPLSTSSCDIWLHMPIHSARCWHSSSIAYLSASLYVSKRGAYWDRLCRDVVGWLIIGCWLFGCHAHALWPNGAS